MSVLRTLTVSLVLQFFQIYCCIFFILTFSSSLFKKVFQALFYFRGFLMHCRATFSLSFKFAEALSFCSQADVKVVFCTCFLKKFLYIKRQNKYSKGLYFNVQFVVINKLKQCKSILFYKFLSVYPFASSPSNTSSDI